MVFVCFLTLLYLSITFLSLSSFPWSCGRPPGVHRPLSRCCHSPCRRYCPTGTVQVVLVYLQVPVLVTDFFFPPACLTKRSRSRPFQGGSGSCFLKFCSGSSLGGGPAFGSATLNKKTRKNGNKRPHQLTNHPIHDCCPLILPWHRPPWWRAACWAVLWCGSRSRCGR